MCDLILSEWRPLLTLLISSSLEKSFVQKEITKKKKNCCLNMTKTSNLLQNIVRRIVNWFIVKESLRTTTPSVKGIFLWFHLPKLCTNFIFFFCNIVDRQTTGTSNYHYYYSCYKKYVYQKTILLGYSITTVGIKPSLRLRGLQFQWTGYGGFIRPTLTLDIKI